MRVDPSNPAAWVLYAHVTLLRATGYGNAEMLAAWQAWAGATSYTFLEATAFIQSNAVVMSDGANAIISYEGTRNVHQLLLQIVGSGQTSTLAFPGKVSTFDYWCAVQRNAAVLGALSSLPAGAGITLTGHSLGGALAQVTANMQQNGGPYSPISLVTFGQPRTGDPAFCAATATPFTRLTNAADPVPNIPPTYQILSQIVNFLSPVQIFWNYVHTSPNWIPADGALVQNTNPTTTGSLEGQIALALATGTAFNGELFQNHYLGQYAYNLAAVLVNQTGFSDLTALVQLNGQMDQLDRMSYGAPLPPLAIPSPGVFGDPNVTISNSPGNPVIPTQDMGGTVELRGMAFSPVVSRNFDPILPGAFVMPNYAKVTMFFQVGNQGWSESWWSNAASGGPDTVAPAARALAANRIQICGIGVTINFIRISIYPVPLQFPTPPRQSKLYVLSPPIASGYSVFGTTDVPENALLCVCTPSAPAPNKLVYFRGIPDNFIANSPVPSGNPINWLGFPWTNLVNYLQKSQWGWVGKNPSAGPQQLTALTSILPGGTISFTTAATPFLGIPAGTIVPRALLKNQHAGKSQWRAPLHRPGQQSGTDTQAHRKPDVERQRFRHLQWPCMAASVHAHLSARGGTQSRPGFRAASWTVEGASDSLIGINPCGCVVDVLRSCYRSEMNFFTDTVTPVAVKWFFVKPGARELPFPTAFASHIWDNEFSWNQSLGENPMLISSSWVNGRTPLSAPGFVRAVLLNNSGRGSPRIRSSVSVTIR